MNGSLKRAGVLSFVIMASLSMVSCRAKTETEIIADLVAAMAVQAEKRDAAGLVAHLTEDYQDGDGRDRFRTQAMAEEYFSRYRGIKIKLLSSRITMGVEQTAMAEIDVSFFSGVAAALRKAVGFSGENYRVSCVFFKEGDWRIKEASWTYIPLHSLFPESLEILRDIFPDL